MLQRKFSVAVGFETTCAVCAGLAAAALLGGCGQKGPLFLPTPSAQATPAAAPASSPASAP